MVVKSHVHNDHLAEAFNTCRSHRMKLNLAKCSFGVSSEHFLGHLIHRQGIEANPTKIQELRDSTTRAIKARKGMIWGEAQQAAFHKLKEHLAQPPILSVSVEGEQLYPYLMVYITTLSATLFPEE
ncbi:hypothetical protein QJS10_CPB22g00247 [Acorus calamus]|uniref:Reverse transcriptase/retrotransposon-derived protein RNase H-like domain-containing protein n=1 Tax=Acorus calamus TaxID=4465 RepID=A0AAV9C2F4_ACOCL|nr:hypothetical protein QJS10_CPB22g00247 [Acorus calamus]